MLKWTELVDQFIIYRESDDVFGLKSPFNLEFNDDRSRVKIL